MKYLTGYPAETLSQVQQFIEKEQLGSYLLKKYPTPHDCRTDTALYHYAHKIKNRHLSNARPLTKVRYDNKINVIQHALGLHTFISRTHGGQLKTANEIRIASLFRETAEPMLKMIVVHELAHFREKEHNKSFPNYHLC